MRIHEPNRSKRRNRDAGENHSTCCHNFQCLDIDRGTFMSHYSIETWAVWSYLSYSYSYYHSSLYRHRDLDSIPKQTYHYPLVLHTSHPFILLLHNTYDINMSYPPHHASSSSLAMTTPSPPTRSGSESRLLDLPNSGTRSTMPKTRSPLSPSPYMDIVRVVFFISSLLDSHLHF
jgi:hypothetical protein